MAFTTGQVLTAAQLNTFSPGTKIRNADGTAAAPSYTFDSDSDIGMYRDGSNSIGWSTAGVEKMQLGSSNLNLGANVTGAATIVADGAGDATRPTYSFGGDTDTGMFRGGTNQVAFAANGVNKFEVGTGGVTLQESTDTVNWIGTTGPMGLEISPSGTFESALYYRTGNNTWEHPWNPSIFQPLWTVTWLASCVNWLLFCPTTATKQLPTMNCCPWNACFHFPHNCHKCPLSFVPAHQ